MNLKKNGNIFKIEYFSKHKVNNEEDKNSLQGDIDKLMNWSDTWLLKFNKSKCKHMHLGPETDYNYMMEENMIAFLFATDQTVLSYSKCGLTRLLNSCRNISLSMYLNDLLISPSVWFALLTSRCSRNFKIIKGMDKVEIDTIFPKNNTATTRGHKYKIYKKHCRKNRRKYSFSCCHYIVHLYKIEV
jgi:hypothetical protein